MHCVGQAWFVGHTSHNWCEKNNPFMQLFWGRVGNRHNHIPRAPECLIQAESFISFLSLRQKILSAHRHKHKHKHPPSSKFQCYLVSRVKSQCICASQHIMPVQTFNTYLNPLGSKMSVLHWKHISSPPDITCLIQFSSRLHGCTLLALMELLLDPQLCNPREDYDCSSLFCALIFSCAVTTSIKKKVEKEEKAWIST